MQAGSALYNTLVHEFPAPDINTSDLRQKIQFAERQSGITRVKQLANTLSQMSRLNLHTAADFDSQLQELDKKAAETRTKITHLENKNKDYALAARCLQTYQKLLPIWQSVQYTPFFMRKRYMVAHKTELDAFQQAEAALKRLGVNDTVEPEKVSNLVEHQVQQIELLKNNLKISKLHSKSCCVHKMKFVKYNKKMKKKGTPKMTIPAKDSTMYLTIDKCGRFVLPFCVRSAMGIHTGDKIALTPTDKGYLLMPAKHRCCICGSDSNLSSISFDNEAKTICKDCIVHIREYCNK